MHVHFVHSARPNNSNPVVCEFCVVVADRALEGKSQPRGFTEHQRQGQFKRERDKNIPPKSTINAPITFQLGILNQPFRTSTVVSNENCSIGGTASWFHKGFSHNAISLLPV